MRDDDAKRAILARRARFVAAAMMGAGLASCERDPPPAPCLSISTAPTDPPPQPCLSIAILPPPPPPDGTGTTVGGGPDAGAPDGGDVKPRPCLKIKPPSDPPPPKPRICLDVGP